MHAPNPRDDDSHLRQSLGVASNPRVKTFPTLFHKITLLWNLKFFHSALSIISMSSEKAQHFYNTEVLGVLLFSVANDR